jgi:hypothetical protein
MASGSKYVAVLVFALVAGACAKSNSNQSAGAGGTETGGKPSAGGTAALGGDRKSVV